MSERPAPRYQGYVLDLDGTVYLGDKLIPGAAETIAWVRRHGRRVVFLSNKPLEPRSHYAAKLTRLGIPAAPDDVINSTQSLLHYMRREHPHAHVWVVGEPLLLEEFHEAGFVIVDDPSAIEVVVAAFDRTLDYAKLNTAHQALVRGARFYATNADRTCPIEGGEIPDCAGVIAFLEATTGRQVEMVAGKPSPHILQAALGRLGVPREACLMVGDRLATDMAMGRENGVDTALVLSGVTDRAALAASDIQPAHVLASIADLP